MHPITKLYAAENDFPNWTGSPDLTYMIATVPRSGSTFLSSLLWQTGALGAPIEYANVNNQRGLVQEYGQGEFVEYWKQIVSRRTSPNGVFGFKMFTQLFHDVDQEGEGALAVIRADKVIRLKRRERLQHAISYSRALQTKKWFESSEDFIDDQFDGEHISHCLELISLQEKSWDRILELTGETALEIYYEDLLLDPAHTLKLVFEFLSVPRPTGAVRNVYTPAIQHDAISQIWSELYRSYLSALSVETRNPAYLT